MPISQLNLPYPDFQNLQIIDPDKFDANNNAIKLKLDETLGVVNSINLTNYYTKLEVDSSLSLKADKNNILQLDNISAYTPLLDYNPSTKKYVDDKTSTSIIPYLSGQIQNISSDWTFINSTPKHNLSVLLPSDIVNKSYVDASVTSAALGQAPLGSVTDQYLSDAQGQMKSKVDSIGNRLNYNDKSIAEMQMYFELAGRLPSPNNNKIYTDFINTFSASMGTVDATSQVYMGVLSSGATSVTVTSSTGFAQGQEISVQDGVDYEDVIVLSVVGNVINFKTALVNTYTNPRIYRSNNNGVNFGSAGTTAVTYDRTTPVQVVNSAYTTSASARPQVLSNGWIVTVSYDGTNKYYFRVSKDNGATFVDLCQVQVSASVGFAMCSYGNIIHFMQMGTATGVGLGYVKIDATTQTNVVIATYSVILDNSRTAQDKCSIAVSSTGVLTACWSTKDATYPNSFNIRSAKSTDGGVTWTKQDGTAGVDQITTANTTGADYTQPCVVYMSNSRPVVFFQLANATNRDIVSAYFNGTTFAISNVYQVNNTSYAQSSPSATVQKYGANVGRIEVVWQGVDAIDTTQNNIRYSYSDDLGVTWQTAVKLTSGNTYFQARPSVSVDINGDVHVLWYGKTATNPTEANIRGIKKTSGTWGATYEVTAQNTITQNSPSTCDNYYNFEKPLTIWYSTGVDVKFYGKWTVGSDTLTTKNVIRMNIRPYMASKYIQAWLTKSEITGFTVDGKASFKTALTDDEVYIDLTETTTDLGSTNEISMSGINATAKSYITLKLILNRASTGDNAQSTKLIGGVSA